MLNVLRTIKLLSKKLLIVGDKQVSFLWKYSGFKAVSTVSVECCQLAQTSFSTRPSVCKNTQKLCLHKVLKKLFS